MRLRLGAGEFYVNDVASLSNSTSFPTDNSLEAVHSENAENQATATKEFFSSINYFSSSSLIFVNQLIDELVVLISCED